MDGKETKVTELLNRRIRVEVSRQVDFAKTRISFFCEGDLPDDGELTPIAEEICEELEQLADDRIAVYEEGYDPDAVEEELPEQPLEEEVVEEEVVEEEVVEEEVVEEELDITEEQINEMTKAELVELCKGTEGMEEINTELKIGLLRATIIDLIFEEEEVVENPEDDNGTEGEPELDESGGDWDKDDWQDQE